MNQDPVFVHKVHWLRVLPLLRLCQAVPLGCHLSSLLLSALLIGISWAGSVAIHDAFADDDVLRAADSDLLQAFPWDRPARQPRSEFSGRSILHNVLADIYSGPLMALGKSAFLLFIPAADFGSSALPSVPAPSRSILLIGMMIWNALVIGLFGTAIARITASRFCQQTRTGFFAAAKFGGQTFVAVSVSIGITLLLLTMLRAILGVASLVAATGAAGGVLVSVLWPAVILASACLVLALSVLGFAWLLCLAAIATDGCSGADGLSRSISYVLSHRLFTLLSVAVILVLSLIARFVASLILLTAEAALTDRLRVDEPDRIRRQWDFAISLIPHAVHLSVIFAGMSIVYVLLRQREDGTRLEILHTAAT